MLLLLLLPLLPLLLFFSIFFLSYRLIYILGVYLGNALGPREERNRIKEEELNDLREFDVVVTTFEMLVSECNYFRRKFMWT